MSLMLSLAAAASAPLRTMSQKVSPAAWWVTSATVIRGVSALPAEAFDPLSSAFFPPELLEQPARVSAAAAATATTGASLRERKWEERSIFPAPHCATGERTLFALGPDPSP